MYSFTVLVGGARGAEATRSSNSRTSVYHHPNNEQNHQTGLRVNCCCGLGRTNDTRFQPHSAAQRNAAAKPLGQRCAPSSSSAGGAQEVYRFDSLDDQPLSGEFTSDDLWQLAAVRRGPRLAIEKAGVPRREHGVGTGQLRRRAAGRALGPGPALRRGLPDGGLGSRVRCLWRSRRRPTTRREDKPSARRGVHELVRRS